MQRLFHHMDERRNTGLEVHAIPWILSVVHGLANRQRCVIRRDLQRPLHADAPHYSACCRTRKQIAGPVIGCGKALRLILKDFTRPGMHGIKAGHTRRKGRACDHNRSFTDLTKPLA